MEGKHRRQMSGQPSKREATAGTTNMSLQGFVDSPYVVEEMCEPPPATSGFLNTPDRIHFGHCIGRDSMRGKRPHSLHQLGSPEINSDKIIGQTTNCVSDLEALYATNSEPDGSSELNKGAIVYEGTEFEMPEIRISNDVDWGGYKNFLFKVWEENSLSNSSLDNESSTWPSLSSSGELPYAFDLLSAVEMSCNLSGKPKADIDGLLKKTKEPQKQKYALLCPGDIPVSQREEVPYFEEMQRKGTSVRVNEYTRPNEQEHNCCPSHMEPLIVDGRSKPQLPHPFTNASKEACELQGETAAGHAHFLRSNVPCEPSTEKCHCNPQIEPLTSETSPIGTFDWINPTCAPHRRTSVYMAHSTFPHCETHALTGASAAAKRRLQSLEEEHRSSRETSFMKMAGSERPCPHQEQIHLLRQQLDQAQKEVLLLTSQMDQPSTRHRILTEDREPITIYSGCFSGAENREMAFSAMPRGYRPPPQIICPQTRRSLTHSPLGRRASCQYPCEGSRTLTGYGVSRPHEDLINQLGMHDPQALERLREKIVALQMQNVELNLFLRKEELRRQEAEEAVRKEKEHVRRLQDSLQDLSSSTLVMDPSTYKQVAEKYIASRKKPVRRTHTCNPYFSSSDLVCDNSLLQVSQTKLKSSSCPSSPLGSSTDCRKTPHSRLSLSSSNDRSSRSVPSSVSSSPCRRNSSSPTVFVTEPDSKQSWSFESKTVSPLHLAQYQNLVKSLGELEVSSSPS